MATIRRSPPFLVWSFKDEAGLCEHLCSVKGGNVVPPSSIRAERNFIPNAVVQIGYGSSWLRSILLRPQISNV